MFVYKKLTAETHRTNILQKQFPEELFYMDEKPNTGKTLQENASHNPQLVFANAQK